MDADMRDAAGDGVPDDGVPDDGVPDAGVPDAGVPDAGVPDAGVPDAGQPDDGVPGGGGWTHRGSEIIHENPWWTYMRDSVQLPSGKQGEYFYVHTPGSVMIVPLDEQDRFLCVRQYRYLNRRESLEFPGGGIPRGCSAAGAARKELREEAGVEAAELRPIGTFNPFNGVTDECCVVFLASGLSDVEAEQDETEDCRVEPLTRAELEERISSGEIWDGMTLAAWSLYLRSAV